MADSLTDEFTLDETHDLLADPLFKRGQRIRVELADRSARAFVDGEEVFGNQLNAILSRYRG